VSASRAWRLMTALLLGTPLAAGAQQVRLSGQIRPRSEWRNPGAGSSDWFTSMRVRADLSAQLEKGISALVQLQDVRQWGEAGSPTADARAADFGVHQGYVEAAAGARQKFWGRVGRQEIAFGEERLVGALDWAQQARAFDGIRVGARFATSTVDLFGFKIAEPSAGLVTSDADFSGVHVQLPRTPGGTLELYGFLSRVPAVGTRQGTLGLRYAGKRGRVEYRVEGAYQLGERTDRTVRAYLATAQVTLGLAGTRGRITLWVDHLSGDGNLADSTIRSFETLYATNHRFYGYVDLFTDIPAHTGNRGLQDVAVKLAYVPAAGVQLALDAHTFRLARAGGFASRRLAEEIDVVATWRYSASTVVSGGLGWVVDGPAIRALGRLQGDYAFTYLMLDVKF
jgi:hypothetical protein